MYEGLLDQNNQQRDLVGLEWSPLARRFSAWENPKCRVYRSDLCVDRSLKNKLQTPTEPVTAMGASVTVSEAGMAVSSRFGPCGEVVRSVQPMSTVDLLEHVFEHIAFLLCD